MRLKTALWLAVVIVFGGLAALFTIAYFVGRTISPEHVSRVAIDLTPPPPQVFAEIAALAKYPEWFREVTQMERLDGDAGHERYRQHMGVSSFLIETTQSEPPTFLKRAIADEYGPYRGTWTFELSPRGEGTTLVVTERGQIDRPVARFAMRYLLGNDGYVRNYLIALSGRLHEPAVVFH